MRSNILLAAGTGSRMSPLTDNCHKSLLEVNGIPLLERIIAQILQNSSQDIVVVTGHRHEQISSLLKKFKGANLKIVHNEKYLEDVNIYSVDVGVSSLKNAMNGYNIIETDLILEPKCWKKLYQYFNVSLDSFWVTHGKYSSQLTGGIVHSNTKGEIDGIAYAPSYMPVYEGWSKMLGIVSVSPSEVIMDIEVRKKAIQRTTHQYYLNPWITTFEKLPSKILDVSEFYARSFNDVASYKAACNDFINLGLN